MRNIAPKDAAELDAVERREWLESLDYVLQSGGPVKVQRLLRELTLHASASGVKIPFTANTPYVNTISSDAEVLMPGSREIERRIKSLVRWNAAAMVVRANKAEDGIGGHISTYASAATLYEVGFNHFFRGHDSADADTIFFQGHAAPGIYSRAFLEGRFTEGKLENFRREMKEGGGLSSYPHPWLMPDFWEYPTVSMGLGPIMAIYQARFTRYLEDRGLKPKSSSKVWAFLGDGETDEPESLGAITLASREKLDNLIFVINCNLQRLDGPVRGNGQIIQELEAAFRGAGWNVIKVIWGQDWDPLLAKDRDGLLVKRMGEIVDGQYQKYAVESGAYIRQHFWGVDPRLLDMVKHLSDDQLKQLTLGGHDPAKVYNAYKAAVEHKGAPTVILARTIKGYGLGEAGEGKNITHQQKKMNEDELRAFRTRFGIPVSDTEIAKTPFYRPADDSIEIKYMQERRAALGGYVPSRRVQAPAIKPVADDLFEEFYGGTDGRKASTTMVFVRLLSKLLRDKEIGNLVVPIVPDEARTFG
ncbi:MAG: pyruvate dehydrogenase (acetyl-transferring), homodimeric type, partial [Vicinamibacterales bacterium]